MTEREIVVPRVGIVRALQTFRVLASMNPFDNVGTARISDSVYDRWCRLAVDYQDEEEERRIVATRTGRSDQDLVTAAVAINRMTREHHQLRRGSSVRGAIDLVAVAGALLDQRPPERLDEHDRQRIVLDAALVALSARIATHDAEDVTPEQVITDIWQTYFFCGPGARRRVTSS